MANEHDLPAKQDAASQNLGTSTGVITINVGGREFVTLESTLTSQSTYFKALLSDRWEDNLHQVDGQLFLDADPALFEHILNFLRRSIPPIFWTRTNGFDYTLYSALHQEAKYFGIGALAEWIFEQRYQECVRTSLSMEAEDLGHCLRGILGDFPDNMMKDFLPGDYELPKGGGVKRKRLQVKTTTFRAPVC